MAFLFAKSFPFCIPPEEETKDIPTGSGTSYPIGMRLDDAMFLFWKAKTIQCDASFTSDTTKTEGVSTYSFGGSVSINQKINSTQNILYKWPDKMSEMICNIDEPPYSFFNAGVNAGSSYATVDGVPQNPSGGGVFELRIFSPGPYYPAVISQEKKYFPRIDTFLSIYGTQMPQFSNFVIIAQTLIPEASHIIKEKALKIKTNNRQYEANLYVLCNVGGNEVSVDSSDVSLVLEPNNDRLSK